jgi:hypothetical protein
MIKIDKKRAALLAKEKKAKENLNINSITVAQLDTLLKEFDESQKQPTNNRYEGEKEKDRNEPEVDIASICAEDIDILKEELRKVLKEELKLERKREAMETTSSAPKDDQATENKLRLKPGELQWTGTVREKVESPTNPKTSTSKMMDAPVWEHKQLSCRLCYENFPWSIKEQQFHFKKGWDNCPGKCWPCRLKEKKAAEERTRDIQSSYKRQEDTLKEIVKKATEQTKGKDRVESAFEISMIHAWEEEEVKQQKQEAGHLKDQIRQHIRTKEKSNNELFENLDSWYSNTNEDHQALNCNDKAAFPELKHKDT